MIQAFDIRRPVIVEPSEIRAGDWMRDLGRLRQVQSVEAANDALLLGTLVRFPDDGDGQYGTLSIPEGVLVTVWRIWAEAAEVRCGV